MNRKEMQQELSKTRAEYDQLNKLAESTIQALDAARNKIESSSQRVTQAQARFGEALVKDLEVDSARMALEEARKDLACAHDDLAAVQLVADEYESSQTDRKRSELQRNINHLTAAIRESVVQEELSKLDPTALLVLTRAWSVDSHTDDGHGFGQWLGLRFGNRIVQTSEKKKLATAMRSEYGI